MINPFFSLGLGLGIQYYTEAGEVLVPLFLNFKFNFIDKPISPYASFGFGYSLDVTNIGRDSFEGKTYGGTYANISSGVSFKASSNNEIYIGLCYQLQHIPFLSGRELGAIAFRFGFSF